MAKRQELLEQIAIEESRLAALKSEVETRSAKLSALCERLSAESLVEPVTQPEPPTPTMSNPAKIALFRTLFRGREDVFPLRWENAKNGKSGYSPACSNEWEPGRRFWTLFASSTVAHFID
jgi:hypothetical protein